VGAARQQIPVLRLGIGAQAAANEPGSLVSSGNAAAGILHDDRAVCAKAQRETAREALAGAESPVARRSATRFDQVLKSGTRRGKLT
jgi:hypothetical protein